MHRKNFISLVRNQDQIIRGKLAFKTHETNWHYTPSPVIAFVSIHSSFHKQIDGDLKMNAFISILKEYVKGQITILFTDKAHLQTLSLRYNGESSKAFEDCIATVHSLKQRYQPYFESCKVVNWSAYVCEDVNYVPSLQFVQDCYHRDSHFRECLLHDAEKSYTPDRMREYVNKKLFIQKSIEDLLEQCTGLKVLSEKNYRFQFYPGAPNSSIAYFNNALISQNKQIDWINVSLNIEKKTYGVHKIGA